MYLYLYVCSCIYSINLYVCSCIYSFLLYVCSCIYNPLLVCVFVLLLYGRTALLNTGA